LRIRANLVIASLTLCAVGCALPTVTVTPLGAGARYGATPDNVPIPLFATLRPECAYDELATITAEGPMEDKVLPALIAEARAMGAHAIVGYTQGTRAGSSSSGSSSDVHVRNGTAVRFRSADCMK